MIDSQESGKIRIFTPYVTRKGKRIYPKKSKYFTFLVDGRNTA